MEREIIAIVGPTAAGKTALAIEYAQKNSAEIISFDSRQFYKEMNIGTAKPSAEDLNKVKHHFIGNISIEKHYSIGDYEREASKLITELFSENKNIVLVGGSGLYLQALEHGIDVFPDVPDELRKEVQSYSLQKKQELLQKLDPIYYSQVDAQNPHRLNRGLELSIVSGVPYSSLIGNGNAKRDFRIKKISINIARDELYKRINNRVDLMLDAGLLKEAERLYPKRHLNALQTVGYNEFFDFFDEKITFNQAVELIKQHTRNYAKRQITWFKRH